MGHAMGLAITGWGGGDFIRLFPSGRRHNGHPDITCTTPVAQARSV
jgi:hypothetical protein